MSIRELKSSRQDADAHVLDDAKNAHGIWDELKKILPTILNPADDITDQFGWAGAWQDIDLAAETSSDARWVDLSIYVEKLNDYLTQIYFGPTGTSADANATIILGSTQATPSTGKYYVYGSVVRVPMDGFQKFAVKVPAGATAKFIKILAYGG